MIYEQENNTEEKENQFNKSMGGDRLLYRYHGIDLLRSRHHLYCDDADKQAGP